MMTEKEGKKKKGKKGTRQNGSGRSFEGKLQKIGQTSTAGRGGP